MSEESEKQVIAFEETYGTSALLKAMVTTICRILVNKKVCTEERLQRALEGAIIETKALGMETLGSGLCFGPASDGSAVTPAMRKFAGETIRKHDTQH